MSRSWFRACPYGPRQKPARGVRRTIIHNERLSLKVREYLLLHNPSAVCHTPHMQIPRHSDLAGEMGCRSTPLATWGSPRPPRITRRGSGWARTLLHCLVLASLVASCTRRRPVTDTARCSPARRHRRCRDASTAPWEPLALLIDTQPPSLIVREGGSS